ARVEQREEDPKLLCEHAVRFDDAGIEEIKRVADERRQFLAKRAKFTRGGATAGGAPAPSGAPAPAPRRTNGPYRDESAISLARKPFSGSPQPSPDPSDPSPALSSVEEPPPLVIRFREVLDYDRSIALFQKVQEVLKDHAGVSQVVLELPRNGGGMRRVQTSFRAKPSRELAEAVAREVGGDVVEVVLPR
ncbi:MAG: hypothetical protein ACRDG6_12445, partial [Candidatus Limnocylindria bacterium]